jgi:integrase
MTISPGTQKFQASGCVPRRSPTSGKTSKTWYFRYAIGNREPKIPIGKVSAIPLSQARKLAADLYVKVQAGQDPVASKAAATLALPFKTVAERYLAHQRKELRPRSFVESERHLLKNAKSLHDIPIPVLERDRRAVPALLSGIADSKGGVTAIHTRKFLAAMFTWAMREGLAESNPVANTVKRTQRARDRVLSDGELRTLWNALDDDDYGKILKLLALTGCRANEIANLHWQEIDFQQSVISLPPERVKNARRHNVPMVAAVVDILKTQPRTEGCDLVFNYRGRKFTSWTTRKRWLEKRIAEAGQTIPDWRPHDLRRTCATGMARLGVSIPTIEKCLNHTSGTFAGIVGVYQHHDFANEKRQALTLWSEHVLALVENRKPTVVALRQPA